MSNAILNLPVSITGTVLRPLVGRLPESTRTAVVGTVTASLYLAGAYAAAAFVAAVMHQRRTRNFR